MMMNTFPMFLQMENRGVVIVGGGEQAAQKCRLILKTTARITILAPELDPELADLHRSARIDWRAGPITKDDFDNTALVFIATGCKGADAALHGVAKAAGSTVNVVDQPALCDALTPSIVDRSPVVVAIGTEGTAPVLARQIKTKIEAQLEPRLGDLAAVAGRLRDMAALRLPSRARRDLWRWVFDGPPRCAHAKGAEREAAQMIKDAIIAGGVTQDAQGSLCLVATGPGDPDLITLRAVQRLQEADVIYYDSGLNPDILDLARRDAERCLIGGGESWPQDRANHVMVATALQGKRVVRLCANGDLNALYGILSAGMDCDIVPGVATQTTAPKQSRAVGGYSLL